MTGTWSLTRCPAPTRTRGGVLRCVSSRARCTEPAHRRWDRLTLPAAVVWWVRPWWPTAYGRAQDAGNAHTPLVSPCTYCARLIARGVPRSTVLADHSLARITDDRTPHP